MNDQWTTPWYPANVKPVRAGHYERDYGMPEAKMPLDRWDGKKWIVVFPDGRELPAQESFRWRGLRKPA